MTLEDAFPGAAATLALALAPFFFGFPEAADPSNRGACKVDHDEDAAESFESVLFNFFAAGCSPSPPSLFRLCPGSSSAVKALA